MTLIFFENNTKNPKLSIFLCWQNANLLSLTGKNSRRKFHFQPSCPFIFHSTVVLPIEKKWKTNIQREKLESNVPRKQKKHFTELVICLILVNLPFLFFDQSETEKIPKKIKVNSWTICAMESIDNQKILYSLSRYSFRWRNDRQYQFSLSFMLQCRFVFHTEGHWFPCFKSNKISFDENVTRRSEFSVWTKRSFCVIERNKKIDYYDFAIGFFCPDWVLFDLRNGEQVHFFMRNSSIKSLIFRPIRIREKMKFN